MRRASSRRKMKWNSRLSLNIFVIFYSLVDFIKKFLINLSWREVCQYQNSQQLSGMHFFNNYRILSKCPDLNKLHLLKIRICKPPKSSNKTHDKSSSILPPSTMMQFLLFSTFKFVPILPFLRFSLELAICNNQFAYITSKSTETESVFFPKCMNSIARDSGIICSLPEKGIIKKFFKIPILFY